MWPVAALAVVLRAFSAWFCSRAVLDQELTIGRWLLLPIQDLLAFAVWIAGFFGNYIAWRGRKYLLRPDGRFELSSR
jgi:ceramide glucosyltransferase